MGKITEVTLIPQDFEDFDVLTKRIDIRQYTDSQDCPIARALKRKLKKDTLTEKEEGLTQFKYKEVTDVFLRLKNGEEKVKIRL